MGDTAAHCSANLPTSASVHCSQRLDLRLPAEFDHLSGTIVPRRTDEISMTADAQPIVIFGAGGLGRMVLDILSLRPEWHPIAFLDNNREKHGQALDGLPIRGGIQTWQELREEGVQHATVAIGDNVERIAIAEQLSLLGATLTSAIHPLAMISQTAKIGSHVMIGARVTICVHAEIGDHCVLSPGCIIEHDNSIATGVFVAPAARFAGNVRIGQRSRVGIGATVIPGREIGADAEVAPGSVVIKHVPDGECVSGVPALNTYQSASRFEPDPPIEVPGDAHEPASTTH